MQSSKEYMNFKNSYSFLRNARNVDEDLLYHVIENFPFMLNHYHLLPNGTGVRYYYKGNSTLIALET